MIKQEANAPLHWNYFIALEADMLRMARYVEMNKDNYNTYSIELVRLYLSACSEVDVVAGQLCRAVDSRKRPRSIDAYRQVLRPAFPEIEHAEVRIPRYGLVLRPWENWKGDTSPQWWSEHQKVKHQRDTNYRKGNLHNTVNAVAALFVLAIVHFRETSKERRLRPTPKLFEAERGLAYICPIAGGDMAFIIEQHPR